MQAGRYDFSIKQGSTFSKVLIYKDDDGVVINLTGYQAKMQLRESVNSNVLLELTTANGRLIITPLEGKIEMHLTPAETKALSFCKALYDLDIFTASNKYTILEGSVTLIKEVTRNV